MRIPTSALLAWSLAWVVAALLTTGCQSSNHTTADASDPPPPAPREFRAVWVATVANIDWPSKPGLPVAQQQAEALAIIERCAELNINAVVLQVRPACDALYQSRLEPWSYYLTGEQGKRPEPFYDPLQFWIEQCHARGIELHAWFNPYRARHSGAAQRPLADNHVSRTQPEIVKEFNGWMWLDPAEPAAQKLTYDVFLDVVKRYDVDGIHIDDYFYPYPNYLTTEGKAAPFPDEPSWQRYQQSGGTLSREDWRRDNVDRLIQRIYEGIKRARPSVKFGISPFGQPNKRNARPPEIDVKFSQYDILYADAEKWLENGWLDYWTPQLYWPIAQTGQSFPVLTDYWIEKNARARHLWPGLYTSRFAPPREDTRAGDESATRPATQPTTRANPKEIVEQIEIIRARGNKATGHVHFSMAAVMRNGALVDLLKSAYATPALVPASPWLDNKPPPAPRVSVKAGGAGTAAVTVRPGAGEKPWQWAVWARYGDAWAFSVHPGAQRSLELPGERDGQTLSAVVVSAVDRSGNEGKRVWARP